MAKTRLVNTKFWTDSYIGECSPEEKLVFLHLLTNPLTNISGIYEITPRQISFDTGLSVKAVNEILEKFSRDGRIHFHDNWVVIVNFIKHQVLNPKIRSGIRAEMQKAPPELIKLIDSDLLAEVTPKRRKISQALRRSIFERDDFACLLCGSDEDLEINRLVRGGDNSPENLRTLCQTCNGRHNAEMRWNDEANSVDNSAAPIGGLSPEMGGLSDSNFNPNLKLNSNNNIKIGSSADAAGDRCDDVGISANIYSSAVTEPVATGSARRAVAIADQVREVFEHWQTVLGHQKAKLSKDKSAKIAARLRDGFSVADLKLAIDGNKRSAYHQGDNDQKTVYDSIDLICRNATKVEQFMALAERPVANSAPTPWKPWMEKARIHPGLPEIGYAPPKTRREVGN